MLRALSRASILAVLIVVGFFNPVELAAQAGTGTIRGTVIDAQGAPLPGVQLMVDAAGSGTVSGQDGKFTIRAIPAGEHTLTATRLGYTPQSEAVSLTDGDTARVTFRLVEVPVALEGIDVLGQRRRIASATRTNTELIEIPQNIQVVGQDVIQQQAVLDLQDAVRNVSGITAAHTDQGAYQYFYARGFGLDRLNNFRRNGTILFQWSDPFQANVEQVEVLKGPAGILFGDVEPGAVVNITTKKPLATPSREVAVTLGEYGLVRPTVDVTGPLTAGGSLLGRLNASYERSASFRDRVESEAYFIAPSLTWLIGGRTAWTVEGTYLDDWRVGDPGLVSPDGTVDGLREIPVGRFLGEPGATTAFSEGSLASTLQHQLGGGWRLRHVAAASRALQEAHAVYLGGVAEGDQIARSQFYLDEKYRNLTSALDLIGEFTTGPVAHELLLGVDYSDSRYHTGPFLSRSLETTLDLNDPEYGRADLLPQGDEWSDFASVTRRLGVNLQDQLTLLDGSVHLLLGGRFNRFTASKQWFDESQWPADEEPLREHPFSPRFGLVYQPREWLAAYGSYTESYLINGFDWLDPTEVVPPTYGKQVEGGLKANLFEERLGFTLAAFDLRKEGVYGWAFYTADNPAPDSAAAALGWYTYSGAEHRSRGVELDFHGRVTERLGLTGSAGYVAAEIVDDPAFASGNLLKNTPRKTGSLWASYRSGGGEGLELGGGAFYRDGFYGLNDNSPGSYVPRSFTADVAAGYTFGRYRAQLNIKNVTNETTYIGGFGGAWQPQWPRRVLLGLSATF